MSIALLEQSLRAQRAQPRCVRVNLRLWYALKNANLIAYRELPLARPGGKGPCLPHLGEVLLVLEPDLQPSAFAIDEAKGVTGAVAGREPETPGSSVLSKRGESPIDRLWLGRY